MARRRKTHGPASPMDIARRRQEARDATLAIDCDAEAGGIAPGALALAVNAAVRVATDPAGRITRARRQDVFDLFQARGKLDPDAYQAVRRLQDDIAILHRVAMGGGDIAPRVDRSRTADGFSDARLAAGERIDAVLTRSGAASARLLVALCEPAVISGRGADWREVVARVTGERLPDAQGAILRVACENLAGAYLAARGQSRRTTSAPSPQLPQ
jgi:hypothetical protein